MVTNEKKEHIAHRDAIIEYVRSSQPEHVKKGYRTPSGLTSLLSKLKREGILSTEGREKGYYALAEEFEGEGENIEIPPYSVSLEKDLINYLASDPSQIEKSLELKEKELKYYEVKFVVLDTAARNPVSTVPNTHISEWQKYDRKAFIVSCLNSSS